MSGNALVASLVDTGTRCPARASTGGRRAAGTAG